MNFEIPAEVRARVAHARTLGEELAEGADHRDRQRVFSEEGWKRLGAAGLLGAPAPAAFGGHGWSLLETALVHEGLARGCDDGGLLLAAQAHVFGCLPPVLHAASPEQKDRWLPFLVSGTWKGALAMTEPDSGSDAFQLRTRAERVPGGYRIRGEKVWVTNGPLADFVLVFARTSDGPPMGALSCFAVRGNADGLVRHADVPRIGLRSAQVGPLTFADVFVPEDDRLGREGAGASLFFRAMEWERIGIMTAALGTMERLLRLSVRHAGRANGVRPPLRTHQAVSHRIADLRVQLEESRWLLYRAAWLVSEGKQSMVEAAMTKLSCSEACVDAAMTALRTLGAAGLVEGNGVERALRDATCGLIYSGPSDIQRNFIARMSGA